ncbi:MAG: FAD-binding oxidoreductase [Paraburkholderia sp.]|nr:MAG: FAD-binding oxidoreductase [Paraburkholderia sp.]
MKRDYDLVIVGGGIVGAWTLWLAQRRFPQWRILLIERFRNSEGATAHSAGVLLATGRTPRERHLAALGAQLYSEIRASLNLRTSAADVFWVTAAANAPALREVAVDFAIDETPVSPRALQGRLPAPLELAANEVLLRGGQAVSHDPASIARALIEATLRAPQVFCVEGAGVRALARHKVGVEVRLDDGCAVYAARAVVAVGPWLVGEPFAQMFGALSPVRAVRIKKVVALHVDRVPPPDAAAVFLPQADAYLMPLPLRKQWLFSFRADEWDCRPLKHALEISAQDREAALRIVDRYGLGPRDAYRGGRVFCDAYTPTGEPLVERVPEAPIVLAGAGSGAGFRLSPGLAHEALRLLTD